MGCFAHITRHATYVVRVIAELQRTRDHEDQNDNNDEGESFHKLIEAIASPRM